MQRSARKTPRSLSMALCLSFFFLIGFLFIQVVAAETAHAAFAPPAQGADLCVATPNEGATEFSAFDASPIQQAIDALGPVSDTVRVGGTCVGVFNRNGMIQTVYISRSLQLIGGYMPAAPPAPLSADTIIDAACLGRGVVVDGAVDVTLENLHITCGDAAGLAGPIADNLDNGGGLLVNGGNVTLLDTHIYDNYATRGGGAYIGSTLTLGAGSVISDNVALDGGGVFVNSTAATSALVLDGGEIRKNVADRDGGGAYIDDSTAVYTQTSGIIGYNETGRDGGGLYINEGQATLLGGQVISNTAHFLEGGGIYLSTITGTLFISNTQILYNQAAEDDGGGITTNGGLTMINSEVAYNSAYLNGGGIDNDVEGLTLIIDSFIHDNIGEDNGGGIDSDAPLEIRNSRIMTNATIFTDPPFFEPDGGGGIHSDAPLTIVDSHIADNSTVARGGGLYLTGGMAETVLISNTHILGNSADGDGGGLRSRTALTILDSTIADNISLEDGGGIDDDFGTVLLRNSLVQNNSAVEDGGGIEVNGVLTVEDSTIFSNTAGFTGGGIWTEDTANIVNSTVISNTADIAGGGLTNFSGATSIDNSIFAQNGAVNVGGGLLNSDDGQLTVHNSQVRDNRALDGGGLGNLGGAVLIEGGEISGNQADNGGAIFNTAITSTLSIINTTISANAGFSTAGGIRNSNYAGIGGFYIFGAGGTANLLHVTLSDNSSGSLLDDSIGNYSGIVNVKNSVLAAGSLNCFNAGTFNSQGGNLYSDTSCGTANPADLAGVDPHLAPLADNGGPLLPDGSAPRTHALPLISPARDFVSCELAVDQRGELRPGPFTPLCDSGAYEVQNVHVDVSVDKTVAPTTALPGQPVTYTITLRNTGNVTTHNVLLTDAIPADIMVSSVMSSGVNITQTGTAPYSWTVDELGLADVGSIVVAGIVNPDLSADATLLNTVIVTATSDMTPTNNSAVAALNVAPPHVHFDSAAYSVDESAGTVTLGVSLDAANPYHDVTVNYATSDGTATAADYTGSAGSLTIAAGTLSVTFTVPIVEDALVELDETFTVTLSAPAGAVLDAPQAATVAILNNDAAALTIDDVTLAEGDSGITNFVFTVTLDNTVDTGFTVAATTSNGTASSGADYAATSVMLNFAGAAGETQTITVPVSGDLIGELDETFNVTLNNVASAGRNVALAEDVGVGTIQNDDGAGIIVRPTTLAVSEPGTTAIFVLSLTSQPAADITVSLTASDPSECTVPASVTIDAANWLTGAEVTVTAVDDEVVDGDQPCTIQMTAASGDPVYDGILIESVAVTVADNDTPAANQPPQIASQSFTLDENSALGTMVGAVAASDPDVGQTLTYSITAISPQPPAAQVASLSAASSFAIDPASGQLTLASNSPDYEEFGAYLLTVQVTDNGVPALSQSATITVVIQNVNEAPVVVNPPPAQQGQVGDAVSFGIAANTFADPDLNDALSLSATLADGSPLPDWLTFDPATGAFSGTPSAPQTLPIRVTATDGGGLQANADFVLSITAVPTSIGENEEPVIKAQIFLPIVEQQ